VRTTVDIEDEVLSAARAIAQLEKKSLGRVLSELARRGLAAGRAPRSRGGFPTFDVAPDAPPITPEMVQRALDEP
jgi:hypothetical protein